MAESLDTPLPLHPLGTTGLQVTSLCIGCAPLGNMPDTFGYGVGEEQALATVRAIFDGPITFADTAAAYGDGESERRIGLVLRERGRQVPAGFVLATKADRDLTTGTFDGEQVRRSVERSLRLLGMDRLPLVYLHDPEYMRTSPGNEIDDAGDQAIFAAAMASGGPVEGVLKLRDEGVIQHLGIAGGPIPMMTRFVETGLFEAAISHNRYTLLNQEADPFWDTCIQHGVAAINAAPYGSGILAKGPSAYPRYRYQPAPDTLLQRAFALEERCARYSVPLAALALQFSLRDTRIASTVVGVTKPQRLAETLELARHPIPDELWVEAQSLIREGR